VSEESTEIRGNTILPAHREEIEFGTEDGLTLVGELALPAARTPVATLVTLHPLPTHGGFMDSHVYRKASWRLPALADLAVLRFNTRGTSSPRGQSEGEFDSANNERFDVEAAVAFAMERGLPNIWLVGWSFGTDLVLKHGRLPGVVGAILLSPPLRFTTEVELSAWIPDERPLIALVPEHDDYLPPDAAKSRFAVLPHLELIPVAKAKHLWVGEPAVYRVLSEIVARTNPAALPLPTTWSGDYETWNDLV
jgi:alpha/beta superfamily hydrolase